MEGTIPSEVAKQMEGIFARKKSVQVQKVLRELQPCFEAVVWGGIE